MENPWIEGHLAAERQMGGTEAAVLSEYIDAPEAVPCTKCNGTAHYKATIGCMKCTQCGALHYADGDAL